MKMIKHIYLLLAALSIVACTKFDDKVLVPNGVVLPDTIELSFEDSVDNTRVLINEYNQTTWTPGDAVSVFYRSPNNLKWQYEGDYETTHASLRYVSGDTGKQTSEAITIVYPYNEDASIDNSCRYVNTTLPATQLYAKNSYALNGNIMVGTSVNSRLKLRSVCGWLRVSIAGSDKSISSISLRGNNGEIIAGDIVIDANTTEYNVNNDGSTKNKVILDCDGVALQYAPVHFYIGVLPQTFSKGITVEVKYSNGSTTKLNTSSAITIARNHVVPMECIDSDGNPISSSVPSNQIWYSATGYVNFEQYDYGEAKLLSNEFDEATGTGVAVFNNSIKSISGTSYSSGNLTSLLLPQSLQYIGDEAFKYCSQITNLVLNEGLEIIGNEAFAYCSQLEQIRIPESVVEIGVNPFAGCENLSKFMGEHTSYDGGCLMKNDRLIAIAPKASETYTLPDNIRVIGRYCLVGRSDITELTLPSGLERISDYAFSGASTLNRIHCKSQTPPEIGNQVFAGSTEIYVPINSFEEYLANGWDIYELIGYDYNTGEITSCWESLGVGVYVDDLLPYILADPQPLQGVTTEVEIERYYKDENIIRAANLFSKESITAMWGAWPSWMTTTSTHNHLTFDISDPNNVTLVGGQLFDMGDTTINCIPLGLYVDGGYDLALCQYMGAEPIKLVNGAIIFPADGSIVLGALSDGMYQGYFYQANPTGNMALYLPGAEYANCEMSVEYEGLSEPTNGGAGKAVFTFQTSADVASFKFAFVEGNVTDDPSDIVDAIVEGRNGLTIYESVENTATYEVELPGGLWTLVAVPYTAKGTAWTKGAISEYFYITSTGGYPEVDIKVAVNSVVGITGNPAYEANFPSATSMCIYMEADGTQLRSITAFVSTGVPADVSNEELLTQGQDFSDFIPDMIGNGYALAVYTSLTEGTTYDIVLGFETIYGELKTFRLQHTPTSVE